MRRPETQGKKLSLFNLPEAGFSRESQALEYSFISPLGPWDPRPSGQALPETAIQRYENGYPPFEVVAYEILYCYYGYRGSFTYFLSFVGFHSMASQWSTFQLGLELDRASDHRIRDRELPFSPIPAIDLTYPMDWLPSHEYCPFCEHDIRCSWYRTSCFHELSGEFIPVQEPESDCLPDVPLAQRITRIHSLADALEEAVPARDRCTCTSTTEFSGAFLDYAAYFRNLRGFPPQTSTTLELVDVKYSFRLGNSWHIHGKVYKFTPVSIEETVALMGQHPNLPNGRPKV